ncbi:NAD(P)H-binding protein [Dactylosporangium matsuzakiense]|uniref:Nucleotide-diphosphate-sugar epimerase n=1 Tax=Dactylosporangium matsuzakiense TaxID=53360 RepID=A0A9W6KS53_9ACTN|nr:NAD(P)H-binding protein [Dactylosporangium matsuzakiense]UWZ48418.1 NAD(P)H-binding protein [Dactylosporangium matsuzakiense]GLL07112.1 nucleotide-diphosphate-sugar epimerase [Dactylosporangium matsuzakiense]
MFLITGATGVVGRETVRLLVEQGAKVAAVSRNPHSHFSAGTELVHPAEVATLDEVEGILLSPRAAGPQAADLMARARERGARRVVVLSATTVQYPAGLARFRQQFQAAEDLATGSGLDWTVLRCADFAANTLAWTGQVQATGTVRGAYPQARTATVDERDIAAVAALALTDPRHAGQTYLLTGEQSLSQPEKVAALGAALGRTLTFTEATPEEIRRGMLAAGLPDEVPDRLLGSLADYARNPGPTTETVRRLLGRPARTYAVWAVDHRAAFAAGGDR